MAHAYCESFYNSVFYDDRNNALSVIQIFNGSVHTGGLTDRLKGICSLYEMAKSNGLIYKLFFVHPFDLKKYLLPNKYDWTIDESAIKFNTKHSAVYIYENRECAESFVRQNKTKYQLHIQCNSGESYKNFSFLFNELFRPSDYLRANLDLNKKLLENNYISISFRFQNLLGDFTESGSKPLDIMAKEKLIHKCLDAINEIKISHSEIPTVLITSDSNTFRNIATNTYSFLYIIPQEVGHIEFSNNGGDNTLAAFLDFFLISGAQKAYQVRTKEMYNSDFPKFAAKLGEVPYKMIEI
ncbi:MAG: hypothetical protein LBR13_00065 [Dysgonamonadaceae bacterium]|nr:hypothetical protein [Dysgonamonadaceae bacterium]